MKQVKEEEECGANQEEPKAGESSLGESSLGDVITRDENRGGGETA